MFEKIEELRHYLYKSIETRVELLKTETQEHIENIIIKLVYLVVMLMLASLTGIFVFITLAVGINEWLDSRYWGFLIVFGFLLLTTLLWVNAGNGVQQMVRKMLHWVFKHR